jgi:phosphatidylinositol alpha-1,6-mannosyltransferase
MSNATSRPQRLLLIAAEIFGTGGIQRFNQTILAAYDRKDVTCRVLALNDSPKSVGAGSAYPKATVTGYCGNRLRFAAAVIGALWNGGYDWVLVGHINFLSLVVAALALKTAKKRASLVLFAHGIEVWRGVGHLRRLALSRTDKILCVSSYTRHRILEQSPRLSAERLAVFPNALSETWRATAGAPSINIFPSRFILSVTRLERSDRYKGIVTVIEALSMLSDDGMHYCVVGRGDDLTFLRQVALRLGVEHRVHFLQNARDADLATLYERCSAFVLPSGKEGFGIVYLEAMYFGAPVIAAGTKGTLDVVRDGETGLLVHFGDSAAVKDAIERIEASPDLRRRLRDAGRATVVDGGLFTFSRFAERCTDILALRDAAA